MEKMKTTFKIDNMANLCMFMNKLEDRVEFNYLRMYAVFIIFSIMQSVFGSIPLVPAAALLAAENLSALNIVLAFLLISVSIMLFFFFQSGLARIIFDLVHNNFSTVGDLFFGFYNIKFVFPTVAIYTAIVSLISWIFISATLLLSEPLKKISAVIGEPLLAMIIFTLFVVVSALALLRFSLAFFSHLQFSLLTVVQCFRDSFTLTKGLYSTYVAFVFLAGAKNLVFALILFLVSYFMPVPKDQAAISVLVFMLKLMSYYHFFRALTRMYFAVGLFHEYAKAMGYHIFNLEMEEYLRLHPRAEEDFKKWEAAVQKNDD